MLSGQIENFLALAASKPVPDGLLREVITNGAGVQFVFKFSQAIGWAWSTKKASYLKVFGDPPDWVALIHPQHRVDLCNLSLDLGKQLPSEIDPGTLDAYHSRFEVFVSTQQDIFKNKLKSEGIGVASPKIMKLVTEFEVDDSGTIILADFFEPKTLYEFYESVSDSWSASPTHLFNAMNDCQPLVWEVHSIYTKNRDEIQHELDEISEECAPLKNRVQSLQARLLTMPEDPEEGVEEWLLGLTSKEFVKQVVPQIKEWFNNKPNWGWEDDYLPKDSTAQGAALEFFQSMDSDDVNAVGVEIVEGQHPGSSYYAAQLKIEVEKANSLAAEKGIPVRFRSVKY